MRGIAISILGSSLVVGGCLLMPWDDDYGVPLLLIGAVIAAWGTRVAGDAEG